MNKIFNKKNTLQFISDFLIFFSVLTAIALFWALKNYPMHAHRNVFFVLSADTSGHDSGTFKSILYGFLLPGFLLFFIYKISILFFIKYKKSVVNTKKLFYISLIFFVCVSAVSCIVLKVWKYPALIAESSAVPVDSDFYRENYTDLSDAKIKSPMKKRNLILIFMESMESSFASVEYGGVFEENLIPNLTFLAENEINFSAEEQLGGAWNMEGAAWTSAGLISKLLALPYYFPFEKTLDGRTECLPKAVGLTDILFADGYNLLFSMGSEKQFENRDAIFESHNMEVHDYFWYVENGFIPADYKVFWGFEDLKLYQIVKKEIEILVSQDKPFCFGFLTVDSHFPHGYKCASCPADSELQIQNVIRCADRQVYNFITETSKLSKSQINLRRKNLEVFINSKIKIPVENTKNRNFTGYDMTPTILEAIGYKIEGKGLGFGRSLFSENKTIIEEHSVDYVNRMLMMPTMQYNGLKNTNRD